MGWWLLPAAVLVVGAAVTLRWAREVVADTDDATRLAGTPRLDELGESARLAADRVADVGTVARRPLALLRAHRRRPWRDLRQRWSHRAGRQPTGPS